MVEPLETLVIWVDCTIKVIDMADPNRPKWKSVGKCAYTPKAIFEFMKANKLETCWVFWLGNQEYWRKFKKHSERV